MLSGDTSSLFAVQRYRTRLLFARLSIGRPSTFDLVSLALAIVGAWSVIYQALKHLLPDNATGAELAFGGLGAGVAAMLALWLRVTRRPQDIFRSAALSEDRTELVREWMLEGMTHDFAYENLARLYSPIVEQVRLSLPDARVTWPTDVDGRRCLVVTIEPTAPQRLDRIITDIDGPRGADWTERASRFAQERQSFMATMRRSVSLANSFGDEDGANIVLAKVSGGNELTISVNTASYGQIMRTSDSLVNEFALFSHLAFRSAVRRKPRPLTFRSQDLLRVLPWRRQVHSWDDADALLVAPRRRAAGLGVSLSLVDVRNGRGSVFVARRSSKVGTYPDVSHVVPSGMMNAHGEVRQMPEELAALPRLAMMSEFLEECFDMTELSGHSLGNFAKHVADQIDRLQLGGLEPTFTGLALDLLNLRADVCGALDLSDRRELVDAFNLSWEYTHTERLRRIDIDSATLALRRTEFVQSGIGSIHLARRWHAARQAARAESR